MPANELLSRGHALRARVTLRALTMLILVALPVTAALNRDTGGTALAQENTIEPGTLTAVFATVTAQAGGAFATPIPPEGTAIPLPPGPVQPIDPERTPEPTPVPTATPQLTDDVQLLLRARADLELLADAQLGGARPEGWTGADDQFDPQLALLTRLDLETLYAALVDAELRPVNWIGAVGSTPFAIARDIRHDLELMADLFYGPTTRPAGWYGGDPLFKCNRATQVLVQLLQRGGLFTVEANPNDPNFCYNVEIAATRFVETEVLANERDGIFSPELALVSENKITTDFAVAWLDSAARIRVGVVPNDTPVRVIGRSYAAFSNMMLVEGQDFQVYVEYTNTTVTADQFRALPNVATLNVAPVCFAEWCETAD